MSRARVLQEEAASFDRQIEERLRHGFIPDLRRLRTTEWFYNNPWRELEFVEVQLLPKVRFVLDIARAAGGKVVELGCGPGYLTLELARQGLDVLGVDLSPSNIEVARQYAAENPFREGFGALTYQCADFTELVLGEAVFDTVVFFASLHHVPNVGRLLERVRQALKPGGHLVVCEPVRQNFTRESAVFAATLRALLPTWLSYADKLGSMTTPAAWEAYVDEIYREYTYQDEHEQSPLDNATASAEQIVSAVERRFCVETLVWEDAFIDKLIGALRGPDRHTLARFLKFLDDEAVRRGVLPPTCLRLHARRDDGPSTPATGGGRP